MALAVFSLLYLEALLFFACCSWISWRLFLSWKRQPDSLYLFSCLLILVGGGIGYLAILSFAGGWLAGGILLLALSYLSHRLSASHLPRISIRQKAFRFSLGSACLILILVTFAARLRTTGQQKAISQAGTQALHDEGELLGKKETAAAAIVKQLSHAPTLNDATGSASNGDLVSYLQTQSVSHGIDFLIVLDKQGSVRARTQSSGKANDNLLAEIPLLAGLQGKNPPASLALNEDYRPAILAISPIDGTEGGYLVGGYLLGTDALRALLPAGDAALAISDRDGVLAGYASDPILNHSLANQGNSSWLADGATVSVHQQTYLCHSLDLDSLGAPSLRLISLASYR